MGDKIFENLNVFKLVRVWTINVYQEFTGKEGRPVGEEKHMELKNCANTHEPSPSLAKNAHQGCRLDISLAKVDLSTVYHTPGVPNMSICVGSSSVGHIIKCEKRSGLRKKSETHLKQ